MTEDLLTSIGKEKSVHSIIILTHNIDFIFIQTVVMKYLKKMGSPSLTIFADGQCVQETYKNQKHIIHGLGKRYRVVPVNMESAYDRFHPKAVLLSSKIKGTLYVGSGNLTFGGWRQNAEIWNKYDTVLDGTAVFNSFKIYLDGLLDRLAYTKNISDSVNNAYNKETAPWSVQMEIAEGLLGRVNTNSSLLEQMSNHLDKGCSKLIIQSPYFDKEGKTIQQLNEMFSPKEIEVLAQNHHSELTEEIIATLPENAKVIPTDFTHISQEKQKRAFIHAKYYAFLYEDKVIVFSGSANCSQAALHRKELKSGNAELMCMKELSVDEFYTQYHNNIEKVSEFKAKTRSQVEEDYEEVVTHKPVQIHSAQLEFKNIKVAITLHKDYNISLAQVDGDKCSFNYLDNEKVLNIEGFESEPNRLCLVLSHKSTNEVVYSDEIWIDHERELSTSVKTRSLSDYIQSGSEFSWDHDAYSNLLKVFNEHLMYTPKKDNTHSLGNLKDKVKAKKLFNPNDVFIDSYTFTKLHTNSINKYNFDIDSILKQYLGLYDQHIDSKEQKELTQEELQEQYEQDSVVIDERGQIEQNQIDDYGRKKIKKLIDTLVEAFTKIEIVENRPLKLLLDDLKVASIILRMGLDKSWITQDEFFETTYTLWTEFFFSCPLTEERGYIDFKLEQENVEIEEISTAELSASMLTWLFTIAPSNEIKYIRLLMSAILVQAKYHWIFLGGSKEQIVEEVNKTLVAFKSKNVSHSLLEHAELLKLLVNTGNAFAELIYLIGDNKIIDYKDKLPMKDIQKSELLWQGSENFYIVRYSYKRHLNRNNKFRAEVIPLTKLKVESSFLVNFTIPISDLLNLEEFMEMKGKSYLLDFIESLSINEDSLE